MLGNTVCIQPGQTELRNKEMFYVIVDRENNSYEKFQRSTDNKSNNWC